MWVRAGGVGGVGGVGAPRVAAEEEALITHSLDQLVESAVAPASRDSRAKPRRVSLLYAPAPN